MTKSVKRSFGRGISLVLLLLFSVTVLPLDFLHNHSVPEQVCADKTPCSHKIHVTKKASYCWACAVHYDKSFLKAKAEEKLPSLPAVELLFDNAVTGYLADIIYAALRGPPSE
jgi:hypothetical protein